MTTSILLRHGRSTGNTAGELSGWTRGVHLDADGRAQAQQAAARIAALRPVAVVSSPLLRCVHTAGAVTDACGLTDAEIEVDLGECRYGAWTGRKLTDLKDEPLWDAVQNDPGSVTFPASVDYEHEALTDVQDRAVAAIQAHDARIRAAHGSDAVWVAVSHGDVIKATVAGLLQMPWSAFQSLGISPGSITMLQLEGTRPVLVRYNDTGDLPAPAREGAHATPGGATGTPRQEPPNG